MANHLVLPRRFPASFRFLPVAFIEDGATAGQDDLVVEGAGWYEFGVLSSSLHYEWMRTVAVESNGFWKYDLRRVYNNFIWPGPTFDVEMTEEMFVPIKEGIASAAKAIAAARAAHPDFTFEKHYPDEAMPEDIRAAHKRNDEAVARAYGVDFGPAASADFTRHFLTYAKAMEAMKHLPRDREPPRWHGGVRPRR